MSPDSNSHPNAPHHTGNNTISDLALDGIPTQHQAKATIDHSQRKEDPPRPDMRDCPRGTLVILLIRIMMNEASDGLKNESSDDNNANDRMAIASCELNAR